MTKLIEYKRKGSKSAYKYTSTQFLKLAKKDAKKVDPEKTIKSVRSALLFVGSKRAKRVKK